MATPYPKEQMHRIKYTKLTPEQIAGTLAAVTAPTSASPLSDALAGNTIKIATIERVAFQSTPSMP